MTGPVLSRPVAGLFSNQSQLVYQDANAFVQREVAADTGSGGRAVGPLQGHRDSLRGVHQRDQRARRHRGRAIMELSHPAFLGKERQTSRTGHSCG